MSGEPGSEIVFHAELCSISVTALTAVLGSALIVRVCEHILDEKRYSRHWRVVGENREEILQQNREAISDDQCGLVSSDYYETDPQKSEDRGKIIQIS